MDVIDILDSWVFGKTKQVINTKNDKKKIFFRSITQAFNYPAVNETVMERSFESKTKENRR